MLPIRATWQLNPPLHHRHDERVREREKVTERQTSRERKRPCCIIWSWIKRTRALYLFLRQLTELKRNKKPLCFRAICNSFCFLSAWKTWSFITVKLSANMLPSVSLHNTEYSWDGLCVSERAVQCPPVGQLLKASSDWLICSISGGSSLCALLETQMLSRRSPLELRIKPSRALSWQHTALLAAASRLLNRPHRHSLILADFSSHNKTWIKSFDKT